MRHSGSIYGFEGVDEGLSTLPSAAGRALELAGQELSIEGWRSLSQVDRMALVAAGAIECIDPDLVRSIVARALPSSTATTPRSDPDPAKPPTELVRALGDSRSISDAKWASLRSLDRYALSNAAKSSTDRLEEAYREIVQPLSHVGPAGDMRMVGVAAKACTARRAVAGARLRMKRETLTRLVSGNTPKGDVFAAARLAGIQASKRTSDLIPLCHPLAITGTQIELAIEEPPGDDAASIAVRATVEAFDRTGVEMEALVAASVAALTIYDMLKAIDRWMTITDVGLLEKSGGRSGALRRGES
jgi:cyclic pyranopterin phosphate synthase